MATQDIKQSEEKKPRRKRRQVYPSKQTLNMAMREKNPLSPWKLIPSMALVIAALALFGKYAVANRLYGVYQAEAQLQELQAQVAEMQSGLDRYKEVQEKYDRYSNAWIPTEAQDLVDRSEILSVMEQYLMPTAAVQSVSLSGNLMSMELNGVTLDGMSLIVQQLNALPQVTNVEVYTISKGDPNNDRDVPSVSMLVTIMGSLEAQEKEAEE